jgi:hypothetical protein
VKDDMQRDLSRTAQLSWNIPLHLLTHISRFVMIHSRFLAKATFSSDTISSYPTPGTCSVNSLRPNYSAHETFGDAPWYLWRASQDNHSQQALMPPPVRHRAQIRIPLILYASSA